MLGKSAAFLLAALLAVAGPPAHAQTAFPSKPIRMMVPFPPGGFVDILTRVMTPRMAEGLGQPVLIDNRPGANGNIAIDTVAKSAPDGYTLVLAQVSNLAINPSIYKDLPFDPIKDLTPIGFVATASQVMVVSAASEFKSVADVMAAAKAKPGEIMFASSGNGSLGHLGMELMQQQAGIKFLHIPYKGASPAVIDVMGGRAHLFVAAMPSVIGRSAPGSCARSRSRRPPGSPSCRMCRRWRTRASRFRGDELARRDGPRPAHRRPSSIGSTPNSTRRLPPTRSAKSTPAKAPPCFSERRANSAKRWRLIWRSGRR